MKPLVCVVPSQQVLELTAELQSLGSRVAVGTGVAVAARRTQHASAGGPHACPGATHATHPSAAAAAADLAQRAERWLAQGYDASILLLGLPAESVLDAIVAARLAAGAQLGLSWQVVSATLPPKAQQQRRPGSKPGAGNASQLQPQTQGQLAIKLLREVAAHHRQHRAGECWRAGGDHALVTARLSPLNELLAPLLGLTARSFVGADLTRLEKDPARTGGGAIAVEGELLAVLHDVRCISTVCSRQQPGVKTARMQPQFLPFEQVRQRAEQQEVARRRRVQSEGAGVAAAAARRGTVAPQRRPSPVPAELAAGADPEEGEASPTSPFMQDEQQVDKEKEQQQLQEQGNVLDYQACLYASPAKPGPTGRQLAGAESMPAGSAGSPALSSSGAAAAAAPGSPSQPWEQQQSVDLDGLRREFGRLYASATAQHRVQQAAASPQGSPTAAARASRVGAPRPASSLAVAESADAASMAAAVARIQQSLRPQQHHQQQQESEFVGAWWQQAEEPELEEELEDAAPEERAGPPPEAAAGSPNSRHLTTDLEQELAALHARALSSRCANERQHQHQRRVDSAAAQPSQTGSPPPRDLSDLFDTQFLEGLAGEEEGEVQQRSAASSRAASQGWTRAASPGSASYAAGAGYARRVPQQPRPLQQQQRRQQAEQEGSPRSEQHNSTLQAFSYMPSAGSTSRLQLAARPALASPPLHHDPVGLEAAGRRGLQEAGAQPPAHAGGTPLEPLESLEAESCQVAAVALADLQREQRLNAELLRQLHELQQQVHELAAVAAAVQQPPSAGVDDPADFHGLLAALQRERAVAWALRAQLQSAESAAAEEAAQLEVAMCTTQRQLALAQARCAAWERRSPLASLLRRYEEEVGRLEDEAEELRRENATLARLLAEAELVSLSRGAGPLPPDAAGVCRALYAKLRAAQAQARRLQGDKADLQRALNGLQRRDRLAELARRQAGEHLRRAEEARRALAAAEAAREAQGLAAAAAAARAEEAEGRLEATRQKLAAVAARAAALEDANESLREQVHILRAGQSRDRILKHIQHSPPARLTGA
eukprot:scaffold6.g2711.t1